MVQEMIFDTIARCDFFHLFGNIYWNATYLCMLVLIDRFSMIFFSEKNFSKLGEP